MTITKTLWKNDATNAKVLQDVKGGLRFQYETYIGRMRFSLFCEVGELYKQEFAGFFEKFQLAESPLDYGNVKPYFADKLK